ncbi:Uncharacterised protein [Alloiococcus otitis]|uniref:Uncharacterized protein n=1 Tax=Alloiococcus otitis ATCC 51267 TaxID=883081 RepID=K9EDD7_9LACT|nr:hypothetical protein HMPREF9698_00641 [Alloiococcus otitis ATCC 51267]SUU81837.1 Uncharacterised protein [Alloiococcus otitis]
MIFLSMCFLVSYNYIVAQKGHYDFFFLHNYMDFIQLRMDCRIMERKFYNFCVNVEFWVRDSTIAV